MLSKKFLFDRVAVAQFCELNDIDYLGLFGSESRGDQTSKSDIDLLVSFSRPVGFYTLAKIEQALTEKLAKKVDLVTLKAIHPQIRPYVQKDLKLIYEKPSNLP